MTCISVPLVAQGASSKLRDSAAKLPMSRSQLAESGKPFDAECKSVSMATCTVGAHPALRVLIHKNEQPLISCRVSAQFVQNLQESFFASLVRTILQGKLLILFEENYVEA